MANSEDTAFYFIGEFIYRFSKFEERLRRSVQKAAEGPFAEPVTEMPATIFLQRCRELENISNKTASRTYKYFEALLWTRHDIAHNINHIKDWGEGRFCIHIHKIIPDKKYSVNRIETLVKKATGISPFWKVRPEERPQMRTDTPYNIPDYAANKLIEDTIFFSRIMSGDIKYNEESISSFIGDHHHLHYYDSNSLMLIR